MMVLRLILKGILKVYFRLVISSLIMMRSLEKFWKACNKYKLVLRLFLFFTSKTQNIWCVAHSAICVLGYSRKNPNRWVLRIYFFEKPLEFFIFLLYPWKFQAKQSSAAGYSAKFCQIPWKLQVQKLRALEIPHYFFLVALGNSTQF